LNEPIAGAATMNLEQFHASLKSDNIVEQLRIGLIGEGIEISTPFGTKNLTYADYTASGRALRQIEDYVSQWILPYYANSHTESSYCGAYITRLRNEARAVIARQTNADDNCSVIFSGSGATSAINRLVSLSGVATIATNSNSPPVVFIGPYEHHSNILPWRESGALVIEIDEADQGGPDLEILEQQLIAHKDSPLLIGSFSAASNVTGIISDVVAVTKILKQHNALAFWDYAGGGPYLPIDMMPEPGLEIDAIFLSPHKFPGGPGASGILIVRNSTVKATRPTWPGGGSVSYVSPWAHDYFDSLIEREEAGTPNVIGDIRAALVFIVKDVVGTDYILERDEMLAARALKAWDKNPNITLLGIDKPNRLPIFSFIVHDNEGKHVHHQLITQMLSDMSGVQVRGGCVCAGPYGHRLLAVERPQSETIRDAVRAGSEIEKPGWVRLNFSYLMDDATAAHIVDSVEMVVNEVAENSPDYCCDPKSASFHYQPKIAAAG